MIIRTATPADAEAMSRVLGEIIAATGRERPREPDFVRSTYIDNPAGVECSVAVDAADGLLGFQSLIRALPGNRYGAPEGWGIIGTHISPQAHRRGVGTALFAASREAASAAGLARIDASIGAWNAGALWYYEALGFRTWREGDGVVQKVFVVEGRTPV